MPGLTSLPLPAQNPRHPGVASRIATGVDSTGSCARVLYRGLAHWGEQRTPAPTSTFAIAINAAGVVQVQANAVRAHASGAAGRPRPIHSVALNRGPGQSQLHFPAELAPRGWGGVRAMSALRPRRSWPVDKVPEGEEAPGQAGGGGPLTSPTPSCDRAQNTAERPSGWTRPGTTCPPHSCARWRTAPRPCTPTGARCRPRCASRSFRGLPMSTPSNLAAPPALALIVCGAGTTPRPRTRRSRPTGARKAPSSPPRQPPDARPNARVPSRLASTSGPLECQIPEAVGAKAAPQLRLRVVSRANDTVIPGSPNGTSIPLLHNNLTIAFNGTAWEPHACPCTSACSGECAPAPQQFPHPTECPTYVLMSACHTCAPFPHKLYACMCVCVSRAGLVYKNRTSVGATRPILPVSGSSRAHRGTSPCIATQMAPVVRWRTTCV